MFKICIAGKNDIAVNALDYLVNILKINSNEICIISNKTDTGTDGWQKSLKKKAKELNITEIKLEDAYVIEDLIFISLEFDKIIKTEKFKTTHLYNIHFSNLPKYKGMYTSVMPILNGENIAGVTLHKIDNGIDTGDIINQRLFKIDINDTARDLYFKYLNNSFILFKDNIKNILSGKIKFCKQNCFNSTYYSKKAIDFNNINIDLNKTSFEIHNQIRAFIFQEYQLPKVMNFYIQTSVISDEFIGYKQIIDSTNEIIISGVDGYKITLKKYKDNN